MSPENSLPVILVSAVDTKASSHIISELVGDFEVLDDSNAGLDRVWHLENKYYTTNVRLQPHVDGDPVTDPADIEAHVIYLTEDECTCVSAAEVLERRALPEGAGHVRLALAAAAAAAAGDALDAAARRLHYELVPLTSTDEGEGEEDEGEPCGVQYARDVLHAHTWPGLRRREVQAGRGRVEEEEEEEAAAAARAEQFAAALEALGAVPPERRRDEAEALVAAFCRALGLGVGAGAGHAPPRL